MSPSRPNTPAVTAPAIQKEVISAVAPLGVVWNSRSMSGNAGISSVWESA
jgi:hypothetical protein